MKQHAIIIGGGAAGFFAAIHHQHTHPHDIVIIIEKSDSVLSKVKISGGGRCNVTHACFEPKLLCEHYPRGKKELRGPFHVFQPNDTMAWFDAHGVPLKVEPDNRVFPVSNSSQTIIDCLVETATRLGVKIWTDCQVEAITKEGAEFHLLLSNKEQLQCQKLVLATGSNRQGHSFAKQFGHTIVPPVPSLFTFKIDEPPLHALSGLSVTQAKVWLSDHKKESQTGPLLITHWGMSGPSIIKLSAWHARPMHQANYCVSLIVNWLPAFNPNTLKTHLSTHQQKNAKKCIVTHSPFSELPHRLWSYLATKSTLLPTQTWHNLSHKQMNRLLQTLTQDQYQVIGKSAFKEEFVTCGGVSLKEIDFKTMESTCCDGLYIVGELLDIDGVTGGFNFQNAWTTGYISGTHI